MLKLNFPTSLKRKYVRWGFIMLMLPLAVSSCQPDKDYYKPSANRAGNVLNELEKNPDYSLFREALISSGYETALGGGAGLFTVFAPNNQAVQEFLAANGYNSFEDIPIFQRNQFVSNHLVPSSLLYPYDFQTKKFNQKKDDRYQTAGNKSVTVLYNGPEDFTVNGVKVTGEPNGTGNGVIYPVEKFLTQQKSLDSLLRTTPDYSFFSQLVTAFRIKTLSPRVRPNPVIRADGRADSVFIYESGLAANLDNDTDLKTLFAPTNAAMEAFLSTTPYTKETGMPLLLAKVLVDAHMLVPKNSSQPTPALRSTEIQPGKLVSAGGDTVTIGKDLSITNIVQPNITASNGLMHGVNTVIVPPSLSTALGKALLDPDLSLFNMLTARAGALYRRFLYLETPILNYTVLAPNNQAMLAAGYNAANIAKLAPIDADAIFRAQILRVTKSTTGWTSGQTAETFRPVAGKNIIVTYRGNGLVEDSKGNKANIIQADMMGTRNLSVLHKTDKVLTHL